MSHLLEIDTYFKIIFIYRWAAFLAYLINVFRFTFPLSKQSAFSAAIHKTTSIINLHTLALVTGTSSKSFGLATLVYSKIISIFGFSQIFNQW